MVRWSRLRHSLSNGLDVLISRAGFDTSRDPNASLVPLAHMGRRHLMQGMIQSPAGIPVAQYHLAGSMRVWIAVAARHRSALLRNLPSK